MRKRLYALVSIFTLLSFLSCGLKKPPQPIPKPEKAEESIKKPRKGGYELVE